MNGGMTPEAQALLELGNRLKREKRYREALVPLGEATRLAPREAAIWLNRGVAHLELGERDEAVACFRHALALEPQRAEAHNILGHALLSQGRCSAAAARLEAALRLKPDYAAAHDNLGRVRKAQGRAAEAPALHRQALAAAPRAATHSNLLYTLNLLDVSPDRIFAEHVQWGETYARGSSAAAAPAPLPFELRRRPRLRIGYVSADFCHHAVAYFIEGVLEHHDRANFEIFAYSDVVAPDAVTQRLRGKTEHWRAIAGLSDAAVEQRIRGDGIDLLIDLAGHTAGNRLAVFARRAAPIQATWLGYPNTTGVPAIDYRITDRLSDPDSDRWHTEALTRLSGPFSCYRPPDDSPPAMRLPSGIPTFGCCNNLAKVTDRMVQVWARILGAAPESRLLLKSRGLTDAGTRAGLRARFAQAGISPSRVTLSGDELSVAAHLALYQGVDVALDTFPYHGATTTCEALWMGVPVVTLAGQTHVSRVGVSMLTHAGFPEGIASTEDEYVAKAVQLLRAPSPNRAERRERMRRSLLCDATAHVADLESAYLAMAREKFASGVGDFPARANCYVSSRAG